MGGLNEIYRLSNRRSNYSQSEIAQNVNLHIDDPGHFERIVDWVLKPLKIDPREVKNMYPHQVCTGMNFNILSPGDWIKPHVDYNKTKLNILLKGNPEHCIHFINENETWDYLSPAILDVSKLHTVQKIETLKVPRVMLQIFLSEDFSHYRKL